MSKWLNVRASKDKRLELKLAIVMLPVVALLAGVGIGVAVAIQSIITPITWLPLTAIIPVTFFVYALRNYCKKIDEI